MSTFRIKIAVVAFAAVAVLTLVLLLVSLGPISDAALEEVRSSVERGSKLVQRSQRLYTFDLVAQAKAIAVGKEFAAGLAETEEQARRAAIYDAVDEVDKRLAGKNLKPSFLGIVDKSGKIVARDLDPNADHGEKLDYPVVAQVLGSGRAMSAILLLKSLMQRAAVAPIVSNGEVVGALVLAYDFTGAAAREDHRQFGAHVAYFMGGSIRASSFTVANDPHTEDAQRVAALAKVLMPRAKEAMAAGKISDIIELDVQGEQFKAITGPMPPSVSLVSYGISLKALKETIRQDVGFVVLASVDEKMVGVRHARWLILVFGLLMVLVVAGIMFAVARHFVNAEDRLELGVSEVINGNLEYTFDVGEEFEGMANALNVMLARLLGRPEPGEEEEEVAWRSDIIFVEEIEASGSEADLAQQLAAEPDDQHYARLHREYVEARTQANMEVEGITVASLTQKLRANEAMIKAKHKCRMVRFVVSSADGKVSFKPVRIG